MIRLFRYFSWSVLAWQFVACAASPPPLTPTAIPPTPTARLTQTVPTVTPTVTRIPATIAPTETTVPVISSKQIRDFTWTRDGRHIVTTTGDTLVVYDAATLEASAPITLPQEISLVRALPTELDLAVGMRESIRFMTPQGKLLTRELRGGTGTPSALAQSNDGRRIAAGFIGKEQGGLGSVAAWDTASGRVVNTAPVYGPVTRVVFQPDGGALLIASAVNSCGRGGGGVFTWNFSGEPELIFDVNGNSVTDLALSPAQNLAATISQHGDARCLGPAQVDVWNIDTKENVKHFAFAQDASALAFSPDGRFLAIGTNDGQVQLVEMNALQTVREFQAAPGAFVRLAFHPDGTALAAASQETVHVWTLGNP